MPNAAQLPVSSKQKAAGSIRLRPRLLCCLPTAYGLLLTVIAGCAYAPRRTPLAHPDPLPQELAQYYDSPRRHPQATVQLVQTRRAFRQFLVRFPLSAAEFEPAEPIVEFEWFESHAPGRRPAILLNPILGGDYPLERGVCTVFATHGFHVALVHRKTLKISPEHDVAHLELLLRQGVLRIRQVVDWMAAQDRVDPTRLGSFGISMGGIATVMAAAVEPRLRAHVVALAGGGIADILVASRDTLLTRPTRRYLARRHMDPKALEAAVRREVRTDPIRLAPYVDSSRLLLFIALADRTVGSANELRLWRALGRPAAVFFPTGHYTSYLLLPYLKYESLRFFKKTLEAPG